MTEGRRTVEGHLPSLNIAHQYVSGTVLKNRITITLQHQVPKIILENEYALDWPQKDTAYHIHLTAPLTRARDTRARESESSQYSHPGPYLERLSGISEPEPEPEPEEPETLLFSVTPAPEYGKGTPARCEDPIPTKSVPIGGKSAIVHAYN